RGKRRVVITRELARRLIAAKLLAARSGEGDHVFTSRVGAPLDQRVVGRAFTRAVEHADINEGVTFHFMRHTHGSQLIAAGGDPAAVAARLGDTISTILTTYAHEYDAARREDSQRVQLEAMAASASAGSAMAARGDTERALRAVDAGTETPS